jgi:hypothetical protein
LADGGFSMADVAETIRKDNRDTGLTHDVTVLTWSSLQELQPALRDGTEWWEAANFRYDMICDIYFVHLIQLHVAMTHRI